MLTTELKNAANDYFLLLNRGYASKPALKLVGDRHGLKGSQRKMLFRGIGQGENAAKRKEKLLPQVSQLKNKKLHIDGYNVLFTVMNFLLGKLVFIANDGVIRDVGDYTGITQPAVFYRAMEGVTASIGAVEPAFVTFYLDGPVPGSKDHALVLTETLLKMHIPFNVRVVTHQPVDAILKQEPLPGEVIATSDSQIMDAAPCKLTDLPRFVLEQQYNAGFLNLDSILEFRG